MKLASQRFEILWPPPSINLLLFIKKKITSTGVAYVYVTISRKLLFTPIKLKVYFTLWAVRSALIWRRPPVSAWELSHCPVAISQVTEGLALMLSGGACWSLWERLSVWTTLTAQASRALIIRLNPGRADGARRACASAYAVDANKHKCARTHTRSGGLQFPPVLSQLPVTWGHTAVSSGRPLGWEKRGEIQSSQVRKVGNTMWKWILTDTKKLVEEGQTDFFAKGPKSCEIHHTWWPGSEAWRRV